MKKNSKKTKKPNEEMTDKDIEKEAKAPSFNDWRASILGLKPKQVSAFKSALNDYLQNGGTKLS
jgi:hypothetical protein